MKYKVTKSSNFENIGLLLFALPTLVFFGMTAIALCCVMVEILTGFKLIEGIHRWFGNA